MKDYALPALTPGGLLILLEYHIKFISNSREVSTMWSEVAYMGVFFWDSGFSVKVLPFSWKGATS